MTARRSGPNESVVPPACQHSDPADTPPRTTPASHASRMITSRPWTRHTASRFATLPPPTQITSWPSRCVRTSGMFGIGNSARWEARTCGVSRASAA